MRVAHVDERAAVDTAVALVARDLEGVAVPCEATCTIAEWEAYEARISPLARLWVALVLADFGLRYQHSRRRFVRGA